MKIVVFVEGQTERAFKPALLRFLLSRLAGKMPTLHFKPFDGPLPKREKLRREVELCFGKPLLADAVIALVDVYPPTQGWQTAREAREQMKQWVGGNSSFYPHAAQHDFEAWLLPFWRTIRELARHPNAAHPSGNPESVNHTKPPSKRIEDVFRRGAGRCYSKQRDAARILEPQQNDLLDAANACPELKAFLNTILSLCGGELIA